MTKTTNTLVDLAARFDTARLEGRRPKQDATAETESGSQQHQTFAHLVKQTEVKADGPKDRLQASEGEAEPAGSQPDARTPKLEFPETLLPTDDERTGSKTAAADGHISSPQLDRSSSTEDAASADLPDSRSPGRHAAANAVLKVQDDGAAHAGVHTHGEAESSGRTDDEALPRAKGGPNASSAPDGAEELPPGAAEGGPQVAHGKDAVGDEHAAVRKLRGAAHANVPPNEPRQYLGVAHETDLQVATGGSKAAEGIQSGRSTAAASAGTPLRGRPDTWVVPDPIRHAPGLRGSVPRGLLESELRAPGRPLDLTTGRATQSPKTIEPITVQGADNLADEQPQPAPQLRARRAFAIASIQRALSGSERTQSGNNRPAPVQLREAANSATPTTASGSGGAVAIPGQVVQAIVDAPDMPRTAVELRSSMLRPGVGVAPEPLKVLQVQLQPEHLGVVTVRMSLVGNRLELRVLTARQATAQLLQSDRKLLVEALQQKNFEVEAVTIQFVEQDRAGSGHSVLSNAAQGRPGQGESLAAGSHDQTSRQDDGAKRRGGDVPSEQTEQPQDATLESGLVTRRGIYL